MSAFHSTRQLARLASVWLFSPVILFAQSTSTSIANPAQPNPMHTLEQRIDKLADSLTVAQRQVEEDRIKMQSMQAELDNLRKAVAEGTNNSAGSTNAGAVEVLQQAVTQIREEQEVISSEVEQHEQTKLESASKLPIRFSGMVLFNAFVNEGVVDQIDLPTLAEYEQPRESHGSVGAGMRQTMLNIEGRGPKLWNGRLSADVSLDFFGGVTAGMDS